MRSIWRTAPMPQFPPLNGDAKTDVLIIGGGMTGILCARLLTDAGVDCLLLEADTVGSGVTGDSTAKVTAQHGLFAAELVHQLGRDRAYRVVSAWRRAGDAFARLCAGLDCDYTTADSCVYSRSDRELLDRELAALESLGVPVWFRQHLPLPFRTSGGVVFPGQAMFHPLKFLAQLSQGLNIREHTRVETLHDHTAITSRGCVTADHIVVATHFPFLNRHGGYFTRLYQERSYVLALENAPTVGGMYIDADETGLTFRDYGDLVLVCGGGHRTGKHSGGWRPLREFVRRYWPQAKEVAAWATQDCRTLDGLPYVGAYSRRVPHVLVATGYETWGMTGSMAAAQVLTETLQGREHPCASLFTPQRPMPLPQLAVNGMEAALDMITPLPKRCPHLGCALRWNRAEHTWDCPCHGSRFDSSGKLLQGPAQHSLSDKKAVDG